MKIQVGDNTYEVDDSFEHLSPEEQDSTIKEIQAGDQVHSDVQQETAKKEEAAAVPPSWYDVSNSQSAARHVIDPALAFGKPVVDAVKPVAQFAMNHPVEAAVAGSYVPGVNKLPIFKDVANARQALANKYFPGSAGTTPPPASGAVSPSQIQVPQNVGGGPRPNINPTTNMSNEQLMNTIKNSENAGQRVVQGAGEVAEQSGVIQRAGQYIKQGVGSAWNKAAPVVENTWNKVAPEAGQAISKGMGALGEIAGPALRVGGRILGPASLMLESSGLNQGEDELVRQQHAKEDEALLKMKNTGATIGQGLGTPNAINSGYAQQLNTLSRKKASVR